MIKNISGYTFILFIVGFSLSANAQKGYELGGWLGTSFYYGDLNNRLSIHKPGLAGGLMARRNFNSRVSATASLNYGRIGGDDADSPNTFEQNRNLSFKSDIFDFSATIDFNFFNYVHGSSSEYYTPYFFGGISLLRYNPKAELNGETFNLRDFGTEGQLQGEEYGSINASLLIGGGWKWDISESWSLNIFASYHNAFTDYLDDVSNTYPDFTTLLSRHGQTAVDLSDRSLIEGIGVAGRQRGNSKNNDSYFFVGIALMKYFGSLECPKISNGR